MESAFVRVNVQAATGPLCSNRGWLGRCDLRCIHELYPALLSRD